MAETFFDVHGVNKVEVIRKHHAACGGNPEFYVIRLKVTGRDKSETSITLFSDKEVEIENANQ